MYLKRFIQLFIIFAIALIVFTPLYAVNFLGNKIASFIGAMIIAYIVLTIPLVILTIVKARQKANIVGTQSETGELARLLKDVPGYIAFTCQNAAHQTSTTIMSFTQSVKSDNVFYMVSDKETNKVSDLQENSDVSFTSWFSDLENGARISSNRAKAEVFTGDKNKALIEAEPNILNVHENAANMAIIKMTIDSVLYENFKDGLKVLEF